jgi:hypothetical protein
MHSETRASVSRLRRPPAPSAFEFIAAGLPSVAPRG